MLEELRTRATHRLIKAGRGPGRTALRRTQARSALLALGRRPGPPDFVGIGVQRGGSSWWHSIVESHPRIDSLGWTAKELHFFDGHWDGQLTEHDIRDYETNFLRWPGHLAGEWTPRYLSDPWAVPLIRQAAPDARLIVILRDPIERLRSGLAHARDRLGGVTPDIAADAFWRGRYATQLKAVLDVTPPGQLLVLQLEQCRLDPQHWADRTFEFLGVNASPVPTHTDKSNASLAPFELSESFIARMQQNYADDVRDLLRLFPQAIDVSLWRNFEQLA